MPIISNRNLGLPIQPANTRTVDSTRRTLQNVVGQVQQRNMNALAVQGTPIILFHRLQTGKPCSCAIHGDPEHQGDPIKEDGRATQEHLASILTGGNFGVIGYDSVQTPAGDLLPTAEPADDGWQTAGEDDGDYGDNVSLQAQINAGMEGMTCACCFGTSIVGGYGLHGGTRLVLTYPSGGEFMVETDKRPDYYESLGEVYWDVRIPRNVVRVLDLKLYNGSTLLAPTEYVLQYDDAGTRKPLNPSTLAALATGLPQRIFLDEGQQFTHLEISYLTSDKLPLVDLGAVNTAFDPNLYDGTKDLSVCFGPEVVHLAPGSLFIDTLYGKLWRVSADVERMADGFNNVYGWQASARIVQSHELHYALGMRNLAIGQRPITNLRRK